MNLVWSVYALADREAIFDHIELENPRAAIAVDERIASHVEQLTQFPESGRPGRVESTRELVITHTPYLVAYCIRENAVYILRVLHGSQQWPDVMTH